MVNLSSPVVEFRPGLSFRKAGYRKTGRNFTTGSNSLIIVVLFLFSAPLIIQASTALDVVINEIAWMGTEVSYNNEWIELYNRTDSLVNISGWKLVSQDGAPEINLAGTVSPNSFYLLERTDDNAVPTIPADQIYTGALGNGGENLEIYDSFGNLIDSVNCSQGWFAGDNPAKKTMERKESQISGDNSTNWGMSQDSGGTPKATNKSSVPSVFTEQRENNASIKSETYSLGAIINEILPSSEGPDEQNEWIEIFNQNDFDIDLEDWQIGDMIGKSTIYAFSKGTEIPQKGFLVLLRPETKITLNNDGDTLNLLHPDGKIIDTLSYEKAP